MEQQYLDSQWIVAFEQVFARCRISSTETVVVLAEQQSRHVLVQLAELALGRLGVHYYRLVVPTPGPIIGPLVRSSGATNALTDQNHATRALCEADVVIDLTVEGLMHAPQTATILKSGTRIMNVSNEHPDTLCRLLPSDELMDTVKRHVKRIRSASEMSVESETGTQLRVKMSKAQTVGVWGWTDRSGTLAHWPGGLVVSFPAAGAVNGQLVLAPGDVNLTFKRYIESSVILMIEDDYITNIEGGGADAQLMQKYLHSFNESAAFATSHVGWGLNPDACYEALTMYDKANTNGTELRALAGNFLYSTGANEFAGRFTRGHFDLPMMDCTISLDGETVIEKGVVKLDALGKG